MKQLKTIGLITVTAVILLSCGGSKKDETAALNDLKAKLEKEKKERSENEASIKKLEADILKLDTNAANAAKIKLVSVLPVTTQPFEHFIDLVARVDGDNISYISQRGMGGQVKALFIKEGDFVKKGQLVLKLDDAIMRQSLVAAKKGLEGIKTQLGFAKNIYQRQKNLWDQGIGTEVQLISAKTNVEGLENQLASAEENVKVAAETLNTTNVYSDVAGIVNVVNVRVGEIFQPGQIVVVNNSSLKAVTDIPENYLSRIRKGMAVQVKVPDINQTYNTAISLISEVVNPTSRGFNAECKIPSSNGAKPGQAAIMKIKDYSVASAIVIPVNMVQTDESGKYVYVLVSGSNGKSTAHKVPVVIGEVYGDSVEIKGGLKGGEQLITEGYQSLYEGQLISPVK
jgi:membrane fusion protein, multidrug efflux system